MRHHLKIGPGQPASPRAGSRTVSSYWAGQGAAALGALVIWSSPATAAQPHLPAHEAVVVARLRPGQTSAADRQLRNLHARLRQSPTDLDLAGNVAQACIRRARAEADPRFLSQAQVALAPWWAQVTPPVEVLVLRATIRQSLHDFDAALADLDAALLREPRHVGAWLTKATIHSVRAEFTEARRATAQILLLADPLTATAAAANLAALTGRATSALAQLNAALARDTEATVEARVWALTTLAEIAARLDRRGEAETHFQTALHLAPTDPYLLGAFADFLLDQGRAGEVIALLQNCGRIDGLLLRQAEALLLTGRSPAAANAELRDRFETARARGERVHLREEARFHLRLLREPTAALALAQENWRVQREPADARLLLEAARAAGNRTVEADVLAWVAETGLEDVHLQPTEPSRQPSPSRP